MRRATAELAWVLFWVGVAVVAILIIPLALIWALNTLFGLGIPETVATWFAALILLISFGRK